MSLLQGRPLWVWSGHETPLFQISIFCTATDHQTAALFTVEHLANPRGGFRRLHSPCRGSHRSNISGKLVRQEVLVTGPFQHRPWMLLLQKRWNAHDHTCFHATPFRLYRSCVGVNILVGQQLVGRFIFNA